MSKELKLHVFLMPCSHQAHTHTVNSILALCAYDNIENLGET